MAHSLSAQKRVRQNETTAARNRWRKSEMRTSIKTFLEKLAHGSLEEAAEAFKIASRIVDKTAQKGVIHKNQAARRKSRMSARLKARKLSGNHAAIPSKTAARAAAKKKA